MTKFADGLTGLPSPLAKVNNPTIIETSLKPIESPPTAATHQPNNSPNSYAVGNDNVQKLRDLSTLHKDGIITKEDFDSKKKAY